MAFDGFTIAALVSEMDAKLTGGHIQKIAQPEADDLLLSIKNNKTQYKAFRVQHEHQQPSPHRSGIG